MHIEGIFKTIWVLFMGHLWSTLGCRYYILRMASCMMQYSHKKTYENYSILVERPNIKMQ
jgi:hypothetical protein